MRREVGRRGQPRGWQIGWETFMEEEEEEENERRGSNTEGGIKLKKRKR